MLLHDFFLETAARDPAKYALVCGGVRATYSDLLRSARALAASLQRRGVQRGDRVVLFLENGPEMVVAIYATLLAGGVFVPVNPLTRAEKLAYLLRDSQAAALVTQAPLAPTWGPALDASPWVHTAFVAGADTGTADARQLCLEEASAGDGVPAAVTLIDRDLAAIVYTSGSTGEAKGVMLTHLNMVSACVSVSGYLGLRGNDVILCALPLAFDYGLYQVLMAFKVGARVVLERSFVFPARIVALMARERATVFPGVPTMFSMLAGMRALIAEQDLASLRLITNTAAALAEQHIRDLRTLFPQATLYSMYGLTECKRVSYLPPEELERRPTSVGRGMPNQELWLADPAGHRLPNGATGELVIRGSHVMLGYWGRPKETAERLKPGPLPGEMVLHSGDLFRTDAEGYLYFVAREDDIIKSRGEKVSPREVENALYALEGVQDAVVVGVPDAVLGEAVKAFVTLRPGYCYSEKDVIRHCLGRLEAFAAPRSVAFLDSLPRTDTGKLRRAPLRAAGSASP